MLIVHKPGAKADPDKLGRARPEPPRAASLDKQELDLLKKQLGMTQDPALRRELVGRIKSKFGNEQATQVVRELRLESAEPATRAPAGREKKGKA